MGVKRGGGLCREGAGVGREGRWVERGGLVCREGEVRVGSREGRVVCYVVERGVWVGREGRGV